jgi:[FeFe] hydrogenase H-cluster maturation GTPase HydF
VRETPRGLRVHIGLFGRRNVGKSSLLNALVGQQVSVVSPVAGTTTDPVEKAMELQPLGPVLFVDTAGLDDVGDLGALRAERSRQVLDRVDVGVLVTEAGGFGAYEAAVLEELRRRGAGTVVAFNKVDLCAPSQAERNAAAAQGADVVATEAHRGAGIGDLRAAIARGVPTDSLAQPPLVGDLVPPGALVVLVVPIDPEAPRGRLILPQVQAIRDLLDNDAFCLVTKERELRAALERLREPPALVVTDSQAFLKVAADVPPEVPMTSFSILLARQKADLAECVRGAAAIDTLRPGDRVLVAEACTHHPTGEDIGRVKIPRWLAQCVGGPLRIDTVAGRDFPDDLAAYRLVVHCGACMLGRREMQSRLRRCREASVPITNYGVAIAFSLGILERSLAPFPAALDALAEARRVPA